ncbi:hypothetical protein CFS9_21240 [Flavobacterium sp. CFS9]|uniref:HYR domain-containing protein n=1 Tax=Flavobacterium sp. CFS9 TaxID=3143118 RepID=A0AAT9H1C8_9FLAO
MQNTSFKIRDFLNLFYKEYRGYSFLLRVALLVLPYMVHSQCTVNTINSGFELPGGSGGLLNQSTFPGWKTTAPDGLIEVWSNTGYGDNTIPAFEGTHHAELNATIPAGLYQDYDTSSANMFTYSFAHRGRFGTDVMVLKAGPPGGPYTEVGRFSTGQAWKVYTGTYQIPVYQNTTRFIFESVSAAGVNNDGSAGNLLDAINFTAVVGVPSIRDADKVVCAGNSTTLTATVKENFNVYWYDSGGILLHTGLTYTTPVLFSTTRYQIEQVSSSGCRSGLSDLNIIVNPKPVVTISGTSKDCLKTTLTAVTDVPSPRFVWYKDNSIINGQTKATLVVTANGKYKVRAINGTTSCEQTSDAITVDVTDTEKPIITCPADINQAADTGKCGASITIVKPTATDNCSTAFVFTGVRSDALTLTDAYPTGITTITWTAKDASGNISEPCTQTITVTDTEKPVISSVNITQVTDPGKCNASVTIINPTTTDNCPATITYTGIRSDALALNDAYPTGTTTITWTATDASGNISLPSIQTITITDNTKPVINCPANITQTADAGTCGANVTITNPTATDICPTTFTFNGVRSDALALNDIYPTGTTTITWTATDASGNVSASCIQTITIIDNEKPVITCSADITQTADAGTCGAKITITKPTATDNCSTAFTFAGVRSDALALTATYPIGMTTITWTATDASGNVSASCTQTITITDNEKPVVICPVNITQATDAGTCGASITLTNPTATDNCSTAFTFAGVRSDALALTAAYPIGMTTITWTTTDAYGNVSAPCAQTITIIDKEKPIIVIPANIEKTADTGKCSTNVTIVNPTATDNCSTTFTYNGVRSDALDLTAAYPTGKTAITWTATDASGNISLSCEQTITVTDNEKPVINCSEDLTTDAEIGLCTTTKIVLIPPTVTDNCGVASVTNNAPPVFPVGVTIVTWTATDINGNVSTCEISLSCEQTITVTDNEKPVINCSEDLTTDAEIGLCTTTKIVLIPPTVTDNCGVASVTNNAPPVFPVGVTIVTWTATDINGNVSTCEQKVSAVTTATSIKSANDYGSPVNGAVGGIVVNVLDNDLLNCLAATADKVNITLASTLPSGINFDTATGKVSVNPHTLLGTYTFDYTICDPLHLPNCSTSTVTVVVEASKIESPNQTFTSGATGGTTPSVVSNVKVNGLPAVVGTNPGEVTITGIKLPPGFTLNPDGRVTVPPNTAIGSYTVEYQVCEVSSNPTNCSASTVTIVVEASKIESPTQTFTIGAAGGTTPSVVSNVKVNGLPAVIGTKPGEVMLTGTKVPPGFTLNSDGRVTVPPNTPLGSYTVEYQVCEMSTNPANCSASTATVVVEASKIESPTQTFTIGATGGTTPSVVSNVKVNGLPAVIGTKPGEVTLTGTKVPPGFTLNPDGGVTVPPNTPAGSYTVEYQVCEVGSNPKSCSTSTATIVVETSKIEISDQTLIFTIGATGGTTPSVVSNVKVNGLPAVIGTKPGEVILTGTKVPPGFTLNPNGRVTVPPKTPVGSYTVEYQVCEVINPTNCNTSTAKIVVVEVSKIEISTQTSTFTIGDTGGTTPSVISYVKVNGLPAVIGTNPGEVTLTGTKVPLGFILNPDGTVTVPPNTPGGSYTVEYQICEVGNPTNCGTGTVKIEVDGCEIKVSNAFSPNGDSQNDRFYIHGLECFPDNKVEIYNRWGRLIFECERYNNEDRVFRGGSGELPGTYFYVLKYRDSQSQTHEKAGYVYISK